MKHMTHHGKIIYPFSKYQINRLRELVITSFSVENLAYTEEDRCIIISYTTRYELKTECITFDDPNS